MSWITLTCAQEATPTQIDFPGHVNSECVLKFISMVEHSSFNFKLWDSDHKGTQWLKAHVSYYIDTWDQDHIMAKLYFNWQQDPKHPKFLGTGTMGWANYDFKTHKLHDLNGVNLIFPLKYAHQLETCLKFCNTSQTKALQARFKDQTLQTYPLKTIGGKDRAYFYSAPNNHCKINNLFLIPRDRVYLLQQQGTFSFVAFRRKDGEIVKLWIKSVSVSSTP
ncbi:hypothetical protein [Helicobacter labacensis]|uniref:hypothetical protein n=1 Tax=Helicobacter labacensis TaxID=2316079 RepID=UPI0013CE2532|nr:hypothetical protein [Helicobacter labacensis]